MSETTQPTTRKSIIRENAEKDPSYSPYCGPCPGLIRMTRVEPFLWRCRCGAIHDERRLGDAGATTRKDSPMPPEPTPPLNYPQCDNCGEPMQPDVREGLRCVLCGSTRWIAEAPLSALTADSEAQGLYATTTVPVGGGIRPDPNAVLAIAINAGERGDTRLMEKVDRELREHQRRIALKLARDTLAVPLPSYTHVEIRRHMLRTLVEMIDALTAERDALAKRCEAAEWKVRSLSDELREYLDELWDAESAAGKGSVES